MATLKEVAELAGVALSTASLVYSGKGPVAAATRNRVLEAARQLGYLGPDPRASSLRTGRAGAVAVVVDGRLARAFHDPYLVAVLDGLAATLEQIPTSMLLVSQSHEPHGQVEQVAQLAGTPLDGAVLLGCMPPNSAVVDYVLGRNVPVVAMGSPRSPGLVQVSVDNRSAMAAMARYVADLGHRRVGQLTLPLGDSVATVAVMRAGGLLGRGYVDAGDRLEGVIEVFGEEVPTSEATGHCVDSGREAARILLDVRARQRPTAVLAHSDVLAVGAIQAAEGLGLRVPQDLTVTGFDGVTLPWWSGRLTTVVQPAAERGRVAGLLLARMLRGERPRSKLLPTELLVGSTSGPAPC